MNTRNISKQRLLTVIALIALFAIPVIGIAWRISPTHADEVDCSGDWSSSSDSSVRDACGKQKAVAVATEIAAEFATTTSQPWVVPYPGYTPQPLLPESEQSKLVESEPYEPEHTTAPVFAGASTVWRDGSVPTDGYTDWDDLYVLTRPGNGASYVSLLPDHTVITITTNPTLETIVFGSAGGVTYGGEDKYEKVWTDPQADGALYITNVTNPDYTNTDPTKTYPGLQSIVYFTTKSGQTGHFDMATEAWTFDTISGPVTTPTPPPAYP